MIAAVIRLNMHAPSLIVAERFDRIVADMTTRGIGRPEGLAENDQAIYYIVATRCEIDMGGFNSVFDQLLSETEILKLVDILYRLHSAALANAFFRAHGLLRDAGFFDDDGDGDKMVTDYDRADGTGLLNAIESEIREGDQLWDLDSELAVLP
ncbi:hypothetical protein LOC70_23675 [Rhodopirellula sp. JC737]|nr:hypothetical protein [Rhodopirellula sp. JC737]